MSPPAMSSVTYVGTKWVVSIPDCKTLDELCTINTAAQLSELEEEQHYLCVNCNIRIASFHSGEKWVTMDLGTFSKPKKPMFF